MIMVMLSIVPLVVLIVISAVPPCSIMTIGLSPNFGTVARSSYQEIILLQVFTIPGYQKLMFRVWPGECGVHESDSSERGNLASLHYTVFSD